MDKHKYQPFKSKDFWGSHDEYCDVCSRFESDPIHQGTSGWHIGKYIVIQPKCGDAGNAEFIIWFEKSFNFEFENYEDFYYIGFGFMYLYIFKPTKGKNNG